MLQKLTFCDKLILDVEHAMQGVFEREFRIMSTWKPFPCQALGRALLSQS